MFSHAYNIAVGCSIGAPVHGKDVVDDLNATEKRFLSMLMTTVKIPGAVTNDSQMVMLTSRSNTDISLSREIQKHISDPTHANQFIDHEKDRKRYSKCK